MWIRLTVTAGVHAGRDFTFRLRDTFVVGRSAAAHLPLPDDPYLSRLHFLIEVNPPFCSLQDMGSRNGTTVNGVLYKGQEAPPHALRDGDRISVGQTRIEVSVRDESGEPVDASRTALGPGTDPLFDLEALRRKIAGLKGAALTDALLDQQALLWEAGNRVRLEQFLQAVPAVWGQTDAVVALMAQELQLRIEAGEVAGVEEYQRRYPQLARALAEEVGRNQNAKSLGLGLRGAEAPVILPPVPPAKPLALPGYEIVGRIGEGGMGAVFRARTPTGHLVAIKTIRPTVRPDAVTLGRFLREAEILRQLRHPNIVGFHSSGEHEGVLYFVMDLVEGTDAETEVRERGRMAVGRAVDWVAQLLDGLAHAHRRNFVHRDIKPANLLVHQAGGGEVARLADFGLARTYGDSMMSGLTATGVTGGTVGYVPPEQILKFREVRPASDQYSAAATLYHLLTGQHIYERTGSLVERYRRVLATEPTPIARWRPDLPARLVQAIHKALARQVEDRHADAPAFRAALLAAV